MIEIKIDTSRATRQLFKKFPEAYATGLYKGVKRAMLYAEGQSKKRFNTPGNLHVVTGHLRRSIKSSLTVYPGYIEAILHSDVIYAAIHEYGLKYDMIIKPVNKKVLRFKNKKGEWVFTKRVYISRKSRPAKPFLRPAIYENRVKMSRIITDSIVKECG